MQPRCLRNRVRTMSSEWSPAGGRAPSIAPSSTWPTFHPLIGGVRPASCCDTSFLGLLWRHCTLTRPSGGEWGGSDRALQVAVGTLSQCPQPLPACSPVLPGFWSDIILLLTPLYLWRQQLSSAVMPCAIAPLLWNGSETLPITKAHVQPLWKQVGDSFLKGLPSSKQKAKSSLQAWGTPYVQAATRSESQAPHLGFHLWSSPDLICYSVFWRWESRGCCRCPHAPRPCLTHTFIHS